MQNISIKDQHDLARLIASVMEVNSLDTIWTEHSTKGRLGSRQEVAELRAVTDVMNRGIADVVRDLAPLERFLDGGEDDLNQDVEQFLGRSELDPSVKARFTAHFEQAGGFSGYVRQSIDQLRSKGTDAADDVKRQMDHLAAGGTVEGDLWQQIKCALLGAAGGAAAASGNWWALIPIAISADNTGCIPH